MVQEKKKKSKVFDYFCETEEQYAGGLAWCPGCTLELAARFVRVPDRRRQGSATLLRDADDADVKVGEELLSLGARHRKGHVRYLRPRAYAIPGPAARGERPAPTNAEAFSRPGRAP